MKIFISKGLYTKIDGREYYLSRDTFRKIERYGQESGCQINLCGYLMSLIIMVKHTLFLAVAVFF